MKTDRPAGCVSLLPQTPLVPRRPSPEPADQRSGVQGQRLRPTLVDISISGSQLCQISPPPLCCGEASTNTEATVAAPPLSQARQHAGNLSHHQEPPAPSLPPSREPSVTRGRALTASGRALSPRSQTPVVVVPRSNPSPEGGLDRKASLSYGHHRQTSVIHGIQHSRNTSFVNSPATSPLSPQVIAAANALPDGLTMSQEDLRESSPANGTVPQQSGFNTNGGSTLGAPGDASFAAGRRPERGQSGKAKHNHHRSQSRHPHHTQELKTVGEYALHHLFNSVSAPQPKREPRSTTDTVCWSSRSKDQSMHLRPEPARTSSRTHLRTWSRP